MPKLLDFGIVALLSNERRTTARGFMGTYRYAAPEQLMGSDPTPAVDLYATGIVLYEMLAGRGPFDELNSDVAIAQAHMQRPAPPLSQFRSVHPALERITLELLEKNPGRRPPDALTVANRLDEIKRELGTKEQASPEPEADEFDVLAAGSAARLLSSRRLHHSERGGPGGAELGDDEDWATRCWPLSGSWRVRRSVPA